MDWDLEPYLVELQGGHVIPPWYFDVVGNLGHASACY